MAAQARVREVESTLAAAAQRRATVEADLERASGEAERCRSTAATLGRAVIEEEADRRARAEALERERDEIVRLVEAAEPELTAAQELRERLSEQRTTAERASADAEQTRRDRRRPPERAADRVHAARGPIGRCGARTNGDRRAPRGRIGTPRRAERTRRTARGRVRARRSRDQVGSGRARPARAHADDGPRPTPMRRGPPWTNRNARPCASRRR